jgi:O-antigen/teichoic acid export membrane protein
MFGLTEFRKYKSEFLWVVVGHGLALVGNVAAVKILIGIIGIDGYGELALGMTIAGFQNLFIYGPLGQYILRYFTIYLNTDRLAPFYSYMRMLHRAIAGATVVTTLLISLGLFRLASERWIGLVCFSLVYGVVSGVCISLLSVHSAVRHRRITALHQGADVWLRTGFACTLAYLVTPRASMAILGYCAGTVIINISQWICLIRSGIYSAPHKITAVRRSEVKSLQKDFLSFGTPFVCFSLFSILGSYGDRWLVQGFCGLKEVGIYAVLCQIANAPVNIIMGITSQLMLPIIYDNAGACLNAADISRCNRYLYYIFGVTALVMGSMFAAALACGRKVVTALSNEEIGRHMLPFMIIMAAAILFNLGQILTTRGMFQNRPDIYIVPKGIQALGIIAFGFVLVKSHGTLGMGIALALSSLLYLLAVTVINRYRLA